MAETDNRTPPARSKDPHIAAIVDGLTDQQRSILSRDRSFKTWWGFHDSGLVKAGLAKLSSEAPPYRCYRLTRLGRLVASHLSSPTPDIGGVRG